MFASEPFFCTFVDVISLKRCTLLKMVNYIDQDLLYYPFMIFFCCMIEKKTHITQEELNAYRFLSGEEPTDEMLEAIMIEVAQEAKERNQRATDRYWEEMRLDIIEKQKYWGPILKDLKK
jgi:adenine-specific DNA methylase